MSASLQTLAVLGSTGSIGVQALEVAAARPGQVRVTALAAGARLEELCRQAATVKPAALALERAPDPGAARARLEAPAPGARGGGGPGAPAPPAPRCGAALVLNRGGGAPRRARPLAPPHAGGP